MVRNEQRRPTTKGEGAAFLFLIGLHSRRIAVGFEANEPNSVCRAQWMDGWMNGSLVQRMDG